MLHLQGANLSGGTPVLGIVNQIGSLFYTSNPIDPLFLQKKNGLSLSHLVQEIKGPKVGLFFHQNVLFFIDFRSF